ncbi:unnamed protein product, partial [marine sediment metagenome]
FAASLLSKGAAVGLPVVLFLLLWWKRLPIDRAARIRLAPYAGLTALFCAIELLFMSQLTSHPVFELQPGERVLLMIRNLAFYVEKSLLPMHLSFIYPRWELGWPSLVASWVLVPWTSLAAWGLVRRPGWWRGLVAAQVVFVAMIAPVLGLFDVFFFKFSYVADHYVYLALPAALVVVVAGLERLPRAPSLLLLGLLCVAFALQAWTQAKNYRNAEVLWTQALESNPNAWMAHNHLAVLHQLDRRLEEARHHYE